MITSGEIFIYSLSTFLAWGGIMYCTVYCRKKHCSAKVEQEFDLEI
jgi:hypothetical protein